MSASQFALLKTKRFLPLFVTQFLGAFNDNVFKNALVILITYRIASWAGLNGQMLVTLAAGVFIVPFFLFSATAGQLADKYERSHLIRIVKFLEVILAGCAFIGFYHQNMALLFFVLFLLGTQATFFGPLKYAILPDHLRYDELVAGNGLIEAGTFLAIMLGTILGGLVILHHSGEPLVSVIMLLVALIGWSSSFFIPLTRIAHPELKLEWNFIRETKRVVDYTRQFPILFLSILTISWFWLVGATYVAEMPVFVKYTLHANQQVVTFFFVLFSLGIGLGSLICNHLLKGHIDTRYVPFGVLGISIFTLDLCLAGHHFPVSPVGSYLNLWKFFSYWQSWRIFIDLILIAMSGGLYVVPLYAMLQADSQPTHRARVIASNNIVNALFMVIAAVATLLLFKIGASVLQVFLLLAVFNLWVAVYVCRLWPPALLKSMLRATLRVLYKVEVHGMEHYKAAGERVVIIANHTSFLDAALLVAFLPDALTFAINTFIARKWWVRILLKIVDVFRVDQTNPLAIKSLIQYVKQNKRCVIFPEGRITVTGALMKIYEGPGLIADKAEAKLLPISIEGAQYTPFSRLRGKVHIRWFPKIILTIFPAQIYHVPQTVRGRERRQQISNWLYGLMTDVLFYSHNCQQTLFSALLGAVKTHGKHHVVAEDIARAPMTFQQLIARSFILGRKIAAQTKVGDYVGVLLPNSIAAMVTFFGLQAFDRVPVMINFSGGLNSVKLACQAACITRIYTAEKFISKAKLENLITGLQAEGIEIIYLEQLRARISLFEKLRGLLLARFSSIYYHRTARKKGLNLNANAPAVVLFTSGSEGAPKGVVLTHANIQANRYQISARMDFNATDRIFNALPMFHSFGLCDGTLLPLFAGIKVFFYPSPLHYRIVPEMVYDTDATIVFGTNTFLAGYARFAHPYDFYSVRFVFAGAEKLQAETRQLWAEKFGVRILEGYGATEASPILTANTPMQNKIGTVGKLLPGIQYQLKPLEGITDGGVLWVKGPNIMLGYLRVERPGYIEKLADGWYNTGDVVSIDAQGYLTILDRVKRFAKVAGEMVSLTMVEYYLAKLWPDSQHAVLNVPDPKKGEQLFLFTTYREANREAIIAYVKHHGMSDISVPKFIRVIQVMPLLGTGKIDYVQLRQWLESI